MKRTDFLWLVPTGIGLGALLALLSSGTFLPGWLAFSTLTLLSLLVLRAGQRLVAGGKSLGWILALAFALRIGLGVGAAVLEPRIGYDNEVNKAGYLFTDAFNRDGQAWDLATSSNSLMNAFDEKLVSDQYGGMLFISALTYRTLSPDAHRPLLVTLLAALFGALGAVFVWGAGQRISRAASTDYADYTDEIRKKNLRKSVKSVDKVFFNNTIIATLIFAFFPEAILLGAAQMREPFLMTFIAMAFYGLLEWQASRARLHWLWMGLALTGMLLVSPGFILITLVGAAGWLYFSQGSRRIPWQVIVGALAVFALAFVVLSLSWSSLVTANSGPLGVIGNWARETVKWNQKLIESSSGIVQLLFKNFPSSLQLPFIAIYGLLQPVLPAVIFEPSAPFWQVLGIIRAVGWYLMLPFLAYAPFATRSMDAAQKRRWLWLALLMWAWALIASLRGGADQWDNPRYRVILLGWQVLVVAQTFLSLKQAQGRWLFRILMVESVLLLVFTHWYMYRYLSIGFNIGIRNTLALALGGSILLVLADWLVEKHKTKTVLKKL